MWSDTGDLAEQLADEEDPLSTSLNPAQDLTHHTPKRVRYAADDNDAENEKGGVADEEDEDQEGKGLLHGDALKDGIRVPDVQAPVPSRAARIFGLIMSPRDRATAQAHGLVGKPLL